MERSGEKERGQGAGVSLCIAPPEWETMSSFPRCPFHLESRQQLGGNYTVIHLQKPSRARRNFLTCMPLGPAYLSATLMPDARGGKNMDP